MLLRYKKRQRGRKNPMRRVQVSIYDSSKVGSTALTSLNVMVRHTRWQKLILPRTFVQEILVSDSRAVKFTLVCVGCETDIQPILVHKKHSKSQKLRLQRRGTRLSKKQRLHKRRPFLIIHTRGKSVAATRLKRHSLPAIQTKCAHCATHKIYVNFKDMGWGDWIVSPAGYNTAYCQGCQPSQTQSMSLLYMDEERHLLRAELPNLIVQHCKCI